MRWTDDEAERLKTLWPTTQTIASIAATLGRSKYSVKQKVESMGLKVGRPWAREEKNKPWVASDDAILTGYWALGLSASEIGRKMGITRNAVIGRAHRLGLSSRQKGFGSELLAIVARKSRNAPETARKPVQARKPERVLPEPNTVSATSLPVSVAPIPKPEPQGAFWMKRKEGIECSWIAGDPKSVPIESLRCCGATKNYGLPFCDAHMRRAFQKKAA